MELERIVLVTRKTRLEEAKQRFNTQAQARFYVESRGQSFDDYELEYDNYCRAREDLLHSFPRDVKVQTIDREFLPNFMFPPDALVVTLGQDGMVVNTAKYLDGQNVFAVNPDPDRFDGVLLPFLVADAAPALHALQKGHMQVREITMGQAKLDDGQTLLAFNDFFLGAKTHVSARYTLTHGQQSERHSSSGIVISTPAGSTGWLSSFMNMAAGIHAFAGENNSKKSPPPKKGPQKGGTSKSAPLKSNPGSPFKSQRMEWDERRLVFMVREPFRSKWSGADLVAGEILPDGELVVESHMPEDGVIFSDGMQQDFLSFTAGSTARIKLAEKTTRLIVGTE